MFLNFEWRVPVAGFGWFEVPVADKNQLSDTKPGWYLVPAVPIRTGQEHRVYHPLKESALFRKFAETAPTREAILKFAAEFGCLGDSTKAGISPPPKQDPHTHVWNEAEPLNSWLDEIELMNNAVGLWEMCKSGRTKALAEVVHWEYSKQRGRPLGVSYRGLQSSIRPTPLHIQIALEGCDGSGGIDPLDKYKAGDLLAPGEAALEKLVNNKLRHHAVTPQLISSEQPTSRGRSWLERKPPSGEWVPLSLASALWLQVFFAISGNKDYEQCDQCRRWFEVSAEKRKDAKFCSNACRFKAYRERQKEAKRLAAEGLTPSEVAAKVGSDEKTVKGWIRQ